MNLLFSGGSGYDIRSRGTRTERMWMGSAQFRYQWDRPSGTCINGTGQCASVGQAAMAGQANVHQWDMHKWDRPMCISGTASVGQAHVHQWDKHQWDRPICISGTGTCAAVASPHFYW